MTYYNEVDARVTFPEREEIIYNNIEFDDFITEIREEVEKNRGIIHEEIIYGDYGEFPIFRKGSKINIWFSNHEDICNCFESLKKRYIHTNAFERNYINERERNQTMKTCYIPINGDIMQIYLHYKEDDRMCVIT